jgi:hypothetical protein
MGAERKEEEFTAEVAEVRSDSGEFEAGQFLLRR